MNRIASVVVLALLWVVLPGCAEPPALSDDLMDGWQGHAWGEGQSDVLQALGLEDAESRTIASGATLVATGKQRLLGGTPVGVDLIFVKDKLVGVALSALLDSDVQEATAGMDALFGAEGEDNVWQKGGVTGEMVGEGDAFVIMIRKLGVLIEASDDLQRTREKMDALRDKLGVEPGDGQAGGDE
jgi:hypothetical protein